MGRFVREHQLHLGAGEQGVIGENNDGQRKLQAANPGKKRRGQKCSHIKINQFL
jgi:hypothetical protein